MRPRRACVRQVPCLSEACGTTSHGCQCTGAGCADLGCVGSLKPAVPRLGTLQGPWPVLPSFFSTQRFHGSRRVPYWCPMPLQTDSLLKLPLLVDLFPIELSRLPEH
uniref:Uncharacterized protein n=1 Tax=Arundo donax TaxID=35708 RepID=A0A0A9GSD4_ARUDO